MGLYGAFRANQISYGQWLEALTDLYKLETNKHTQQQVHEYLTNYELVAGAQSALQTITQAGYKTLLLAGSFQTTAEAVASKLGIDAAIATTKCVFDAVGMLSSIESAGNEREEKVTLLQNYCTANQLELAETIVVGSGGNNLGLFNIAGQSITFSVSNDELQAKATYVVDNLTDVATLLSTS